MLVEQRRERVRDCGIFVLSIWSCEGEKGGIVMGYFAIPTAIFGFFVSSALTMVFWNIIAPWVGVGSIGYVNAMVITIAIWLVVAPLAAAVSRRSKVV